MTHERRHVEGGREAGLTVVEQVTEAYIRLLGRAEAGELAHRPEAPAVHRLVDAARVRVLAGNPDLLERRQVGRGVHRLDVLPRDRREERVALTSNRHRARV